MRTINVEEITAAVAKLAISANYNLSEDVCRALTNAREQEISPVGQSVLTQLTQNADIARTEQMPLCQDTGMAVVFIDIGQDVHISGGSLAEAVNAGVAKGYREGYLRQSVVIDPVFNRKNTGDNTPAILHTTLVTGDKLKIWLTPKGFGSENMSALKMFKPADGLAAVKKFVVDTVLTAGSNPCPPVVIGVGIGGTMEKAALMAKRALLRPVNRSNTDPNYARLEEELLALINKTGVGPQGLGGIVTALAVNVEYFPTHIAGLPVAVNVNCYAARHAETEL